MAVDSKCKYSFDGNELCVFEACEYTDCSSLILKYQRNELHYKHSYSITPGQIHMKKKKKKNTNFKFKKCTEITENHLS